MAGVSNQTSIRDLPTELLEYIFTFLDIKQRIGTESVCKRWRLVGTRVPWSYPTRLRLGSHYHKQIRDCRINDHILLAVVSRCGSALKKLQLSTHNTDVTDKSLKEIGHYVPNLVTLTLYLSSNENGCLKTFAEGCPNLKVFQIDSVEDTPYNEGMYAIAKSCRSLECLYISNLHIVGSWLAVINPKICLLNLNCCVVMREAMLSLIGRCNALQELALEECADLDVNLLHDMFQHFRRTLTVLRVIHHFQVVDWRLLISTLNNLHTLSLFGCSVVDDDLMRVLAWTCVKLQALDIGASTVTDSGLIALRRLPHLKLLHISHGYYISGYGLEVLAMKGVLEQVTLLSAGPELKETCVRLAALHTNMRFVTE